MTGDLPRRAELMAVAEVSRAIASELDLDKLLQLVVNLLGERFGYPFVHIFIVHPGRRWIEFKAGYGLYAAHLNPPELSFPLDDPGGIIPWVARTGQPALISNVYHDAHFRPLSLPGIDIKSELTVPLVFGNDVLGVFDVESESFDAFTSHDQWLLETVAANVAVALRNAILYRSERWRRQAADSLRRIAGVVRAKETLDNTLLAILEQLGASLPVTFAAIWLTTAEGYQYKTGYQVPRQPPSGPIAHPWFDRIVVAKSSLIRRPDDEAAPGARDFDPRHSALGAVLEVDENVLGVLVLVHRQPNRFGREARRLVEIFAGNAAIIIENTELYHRAREQAWISTALLQVAEATRSLQTLPEVLAAVVRVTPMIAGVDACAIWLYHSAAETYCLAAGYGFTGSQKQTLQDHPLPKAGLLPLQLAILKQPLSIPPGDAPGRLPPPLAPVFESDLSLFLPLLSQGALNGIMVMRFDPGQILSAERLRMLSGIAHQAASAVQTAQLIEAEQAEAYVSTALLQVAQTVVVSSDLSEVLDSVARITPMLVGVSYCLVFLYSGGDTYTLAAAYGLKSVALPLELPLADFVDLKAAIVRQEPRSIADAAGIPPPLRQAFTTPQFRGLVLPLVVQGNAVGALMVADDRSRPALPAKRRDILTGIAYQVALAIDNARLYARRARQEQIERELQLAQEIQASFIPHELPNLPGWELATFWKMAREVGGDFFDLIPLPGEKLLVIIADAADKGLPASLFMARTSSLVRATALEFDRPAQILSRVNHLLTESAQQGMFVTAFCAVVHLKTGRALYASAGHNPPLLVRKSGRTSTLKATGIVLGVVDPADFEQKTTTLRPGDGIVFYTDGVTEAFNPREEMFGLQQLKKTVKTHWQRPAAEVVSAVHQTVFAFARPHPQSDDFTLLLLRNSGPDGARPV
ncbi:MAG: SpoIIE family protein phosphatase [Anaerolineae bacterium]